MDQSMNGLMEGRWRDDRWIYIYLYIMINIDWLVGWLARTHLAHDLAKACEEEQHRKETSYRQQQQQQTNNTTHINVIKPTTISYHNITQHSGGWACLDQSTQRDVPSVSFCCISFRFDLFSFPGRVPIAAPPISRQSSTTATIIWCTSNSFSLCWVRYPIEALSRACLGKLIIMLMPWKQHKKPFWHTMRFPLIR